MSRAATPTDGRQDGGVASILYAKRDRVAYVTLNRPDVRNALDAPATERLWEVFCDFRDDPELWVCILTGAGDRAFSAGADLKAVAAAARDGALARGRPFGGITAGFECPKPIIAAVNGFAVGGGFELALACDIVVAADHARFGLPEPKVGLVAAGSGGIHRLVRQAPLKAAMGLLLTGRQIDAAEAWRLGLVNDVVPGAELPAAADRWAADILACAPLSVQATKRAAMSGLDRPLADAIEQDWSLLPELQASEDFREGPRAFAEKRAPVWKGR